MNRMWPNLLIELNYTKLSYYSYLLLLLLLLLLLQAIFLPVSIQSINRMWHVTICGPYNQLVDLRFFLIICVRLCVMALRVAAVVG